MTTKKKAPAKKAAPKRVKSKSVTGRYPNHLADAIDKSGVSRGALSRQLDVDRSHVTRLVLGHYNPTVTMALALCRELGTTVEKTQVGSVTVADPMSGMLTAVVPTLVKNSSIPKNPPGWGGRGTVTTVDVSELSVTVTKAFENDVPPIAPEATPVTW